jgi:BirA family transcriptional regulator, biotin operon repressor / biotin---[acetyl-CoA-carboxylase] ligase
MLTEDSLLEAVRAADVDVPPRYAEVTGSTNSDALELAQAGAPEWTVVGAGHQTEGRGRRGRSWSTAPGKALLFSVILRPSSPPELAPILSLLAADGMAGACGDVAGVEVGCKWPNDLVVGERKVAGILPEASVSDGRLRSVVIGIGLNVAMSRRDFTEDIRPHATSLALEGGEVDAGGLLSRFLRRFREAYPADPQLVVEAYARRCVTLGRRVRAIESGGAEVEGRAIGLDDRGNLMVETAGGQRTVSFGEVVHLR